MYHLIIFFFRRLDLISGGNQTKGFSDTRPEYYCLLMNALHCRRQCHKKPSSDLPTCLLVWSYAISLMILLFTKIKKMISTQEALCFTDLASFLFYLFILVIHILIIHYIRIVFAKSTKLCVQVDAKEYTGNVISSIFMEIRFRAL